MLLAIAPLTDGEIPAPALLALAAEDREWNDDAVALLELAVHTRPGLDDLTHHLMSHDVAGEHRGDEIVEQVKIGTADRATRDFDDCIARIFDFGIGDRIAADIFLAVPNESAHAGGLHQVAVIQKRRH